MSNTIDSIIATLLCKVQKCYHEFYIEEIDQQIDRELEQLEVLVGEIELFITQSKMGSMNMSYSSLQNKTANKNQRYMEW